MPPTLKTYAQQVEDLLSAYRQASKGKLVVEKLDPKPDSDAEDSARLDGVEGQMTSILGGDKIYMGLSISMLDEKVALPWLDPQRERQLEYDISRAIARVINPTPPTIGIMSALPIFGSAQNPMMMRQMGQQPQEPWVFVSELKKDFTVKEIPMTATKIDDDVKLLVVVQPRDISDAAQYAIDQFVLRGGRLLAFVDPHAYFDQKHDQMAQVLGESSGQSSLAKLLKGWGLDMDLNKVAADTTFAAQNPQNGGKMPAVLLVNREGINPDDIVTSEIDNVVLPFAGVFTGKPADGLKETVLMHTTKESELVEGMTASIAGDQIMKDFKPSNVEYALAVRLTGKFKTAFPDGPPKGESAATNAAPQLKESKTDGAVVLVGDSDLLADQVCVQIQEFMGYRVPRPVNGNLNFFQSMVEQLSGDDNLISLRSRASISRPFTRLREMEAKAGRQWEDKVKELEAQKAETERKVSELQASKQGSQKFILSPEQQQELANFQKSASQVNKQIKDVQKQLRRDTDSLEFWTKVINIGLMPALVALTGVVLAVVKRKKTAAK
jgi:ABC-type uncharacterized transport system involved in gliding motility auxiliary subunit